MLTPPDLIFLSSSPFAFASYTSHRIIIVIINILLYDWCEFRQTYDGHTLYIILLYESMPEALVAVGMCHMRIFFFLILLFFPGRKEKRKLIRLV